MPTANAPESPSPEALRAWRRDRDLSAASAAALVYTTARSWLRWEAGASPMPPALWELARLKRASAIRSGARGNEALNFADGRQQIPARDQQSSA